MAIFDPVTLRNKLGTASAAIDDVSTYLRQLPPEGMPEKPAGWLTAVAGIVESNAATTRRACEILDTEA